MRMARPSLRKISALAGFSCKNWFDGRCDPEPISRSSFLTRCSVNMNVSQAGRLLQHRKEDVVSLTLICCQTVVEYRFARGISNQTLVGDLARELLCKSNEEKADKVPYE